jgi:hypothetical protein
MFCTNMKYIELISANMIGGAATSIDIIGIWEHHNGMG